MANYRHMGGGYTFDDTRSRYNKRDNTNNGYETHSPQWGKHGHGSSNEGHPDHVCKPVIIDALGRKRPIVSYGPTSGHQTNGIVTKTETIIEEVHMPPVIYGHSSPAKDYGAYHGGWNSYDQPPKVDEFFSKVQHEASQPERTSPRSGTHWRQTDNYEGYNGSNGYGSNYNHGSNGWNGPSGKTVGDPYFDGYKGHHQMEREQDGRHEPTINTSGGWVRPSHLGWAIPPGKDIPLNQPTNDIGTVSDYMKDAARHTPANMAPVKPWATVPTPTVPTINSSDARRKYGSFSESPQSVKTANSYSPTIDSREAVRRYGGQLM